MRGNLEEPPCPDWDGEASCRCETCEEDTEHVIERWGWMMWTKCLECGTEGEHDMRDEYDGPDDERQEEIERGY